MISNSAPASADPGANHSSLLGAVTRCQALTDASQRLACYDKAVRALDAAEQKRDVIVVDRAQVRQTRKTLFGLSLPSLAIFGDGSGRDDKAEEIDEIEGTVARAEINAGGSWTITLADGARWRQTDDNVIAARPRPGDKVTIRRAALGSFKLSVGRQPAVKARREN